MLRSVCAITLAKQMLFEVGNGGKLQSSEILYINLTTIDKIYNIDFIFRRSVIVMGINTVKNRKRDKNTGYD